jgi:hypothetical protein
MPPRVLSTRHAFQTRLDFRRKINRDYTARFSSHYGSLILAATDFFPQTSRSSRAKTIVSSSHELKENPGNGRTTSKAKRNQKANRIRAVVHSLSAPKLAVRSFSLPSPVKPPPQTQYPYFNVSNARHNDVLRFSHRPA